MVDVIIPVYNGKAFIAKALDSVLNQTKLPKTIFVINDGSTDGTGDIIDLYSNKSPIPIVHIKQPNKGLSAARNTGIKASTSPLLAFLDADDVWMPEKLERQVTLFTDESIGLVYADYVVIDEVGAVVNDSHAHVIPKARGSIFNEILEKNSISSSGSGVIIRRQCFDMCGFFDERLTSYEDWDMWIRIAKEYKIDFVNQALVQIRRHNKNMQRDMQRMLRNEIIMYRNTINRFNLKEVPRKWADNLCLIVFLTFPWSISTFKKISRAFSKEHAEILFAPYKSIQSYLVHYTYKKLKQKILSAL